MERKLFDASQKGDTKEVKRILVHKPEVDVNWGYRDDTALHNACRGGHVGMVQVLLLHPRINVNLLNRGGCTPFRLSCSTDLRKHEIMKLLLRDSRVKVNIHDSRGRGPVWWASYHGRLTAIKWMIALRGNELDTEKRGKSVQDSAEYSPIEIARKKGYLEVVSLLDRFMTNPVQVQREICAELGVIWPPADLFAIIIFLCEDFLRMKSPSTGAHNPTTRFFNIALRLPMELQMVLCHRAYGSSRENIPSQDSEMAFRDLANVFLLPTSPPSFQRRFSSLWRRLTSS
jgi:hypothetical protein